MVEGNQERPLPHISDTLHILKLRIPEDFTVYGETLSDEAIIEAGNDAKICVQNYLRQQLPRNANVNPSVYITGYCRQVSVHNIAYLPLALPRQKEKRDSQKCMGVVGRTAPWLGLHWRRTILKMLLAMGLRGQRIRLPGQRLRKKGIQR
ncbi:hypothetical protein ERJ75_001226900 [Trypanosoma vivax]|nr:hypothetical protein ERJ75_001226900 [Trypanosoma vivax]